jgi:hypothetical protein
MMWALWERGIVAHLMIKVYNKSVNWPALGSDEEKRYFQYVVARYQAFPNVVWDFSKESRKEPDNELKYNLVGLFRAEDAYRRLITQHDDPHFTLHPRYGHALDFHTTQQHDSYEATASFYRALRRSPLLDAEFGYEYGVDKLPTHAHRNQCDWKEHLRRAWSLVFAGSHVVYYYNNTAWDVIKPDPEPPGMARWQILKQTMTALPFTRMEPRPELAVGAACLSEPGGVLAFYLTGKRFTANLTRLPAGAVATWIDTWTGRRLDLGPSESALQTFTKPADFGDAPAVLVVRKPAL